MSRPGSPIGNSASEISVTPALFAQHDCSAAVEHDTDEPRCHLHHDAPRVSSPSLAESPTTRQWSKRSSSFPRTIASANFLKITGSNTSHDPQLSERDSIFATHYLPPESEANTPRVRPVPDAHSEKHAGLTIKREDATASPLASKSHPSPSDTRYSSMEADVRTDHPPRPSFSSSSVVALPSLLPAASSNVTLASLQGAGATDTSRYLPQITTYDISDKNTTSAKAPFDSSSRSSTFGEMAIPLSPPTNTFSLDHLTPDLHSIPHYWPREDNGHVERETRFNRSSSKGRGGRVEISIEPSLTRPEPTPHTRSRKSSHYLGLFKENTTSPERERREDLVSPSDETTQSLEESTSLESGDEQVQEAPHDLATLDRVPLRTPRNPIQPPISKAGEMDEMNQLKRVERSPTSPRRSLPRPLLEEIQNFHLTPGGARGTSFSESIPTQFFDRDHEHGRSREKPTVSDADQQNEPGELDRPEEDDDEQISSLLYIPHETVTLSEDVDQFRRLRDSETNVQALEHTDKGLTLENEISRVDISLRSKNENKILHADLQEMQLTPTDRADEPFTIVSDLSGDSTYESDFISVDETRQSAREEEWSLTDDVDVTPTATPVQAPRYFRSGRTQREPLGAVELKPYRHQVGGHTTVFRFSRRAVCKQLNNRENLFYERIERRHPEMLMFLPKYIGVLNVTFSKVPKHPKIRPDGNVEQTEIESITDAGKDGKEKAQPSGDKARKLRPADQSRMFSHQQVTGIIPKVMLEDNRHIIPADLFSRQTRPITADSSTTAQSSSLAQLEKLRENTYKIGRKEQEMPIVPSLKRQSNIWGATTVNRKLQEQVLREVFSPPAIHHHRRHARGHLGLRRNNNLDSNRRRSNVPEDIPSFTGQNDAESKLSRQSSAIEIAKRNVNQSALSSSASTAFEASHRRLGRTQTQESVPRSSTLSLTRRVRRRHSGSGLQRVRCIGSCEQGDLIYFEDDGYGGDGEEDIFPMDRDVPVQRTLSASDNAIAVSVAKSNVAGSYPQSGTTQETPTPFTRHDPMSEHSLYLPSNPKEAQTRKDERTQLFLLLEDLTAGMNKPCVLDLKMGTRQYGIDATEKKKKSQRRKCQTTTSQQLGVRLCGMQTWNVRNGEYLFEDKYFGRDLKSGREFQDALIRFLYDGVSYRSVTKKIPIILEKLSKLENIIRGLKRYRFYASSLLILYDGEQNDQKRGESQRDAHDDAYNNAKVQLKIVDFANCVTGEDELPLNAPCPPYHPEDIDRGYLRGLRSLRMYFQRILKEISQDDYVERGEGEAMAHAPRGCSRDSATERYWDEEVLDDDAGEASV